MKEEILNLIIENYNEDIFEKIKKLKSLYYEIEEKNILEHVKEDIQYYFSKEEINNLEIWFIFSVDLFLKELLLYLVQCDYTLKINKLKILIEEKHIHKTTIKGVLCYQIGCELDNIIFNSNNLEQLIEML